MIYGSAKLYISDSPSIPDTSHATVLASNSAPLLASTLGVHLPIPIHWGIPTTTIPHLPAHGEQQPCGASPWPCTLTGEVTGRHRCTGQEIILPSVTVSVWCPGAPTLLTLSTVV